MVSNQPDRRHYIRRVGLAAEVARCLYYGLGSPTAIAEKLTDRFGMTFRPTDRDFDRALKMLEQEGEI